MANCHVTEPWAALIGQRRPTHTQIHGDTQGEKGEWKMAAMSSSCSWCLLLVARCPDVDLCLPTRHAHRFVTFVIVFSIDRSPLRHFLGRRKDQIPKAVFRRRLFWTTSTVWVVSVPVALCVRWLPTRDPLDFDSSFPTYTGKMPSPSLRSPLYSLRRSKRKGTKRGAAGTSRVNSGKHMVLMT